MFPNQSGNCPGIDHGQFFFDSLPYFPIVELENIGIVRPSSTKTEHYEQKYCNPKLGSWPLWSPSLLPLTDSLHKPRESSLLDTVCCLHSLLLYCPIWLNILRCVDHKQCQPAPAFHKWFWSAGGWAPNSAAGRWEVQDAVFGKDAIDSMRPIIEISLIDTSTNLVHANPLFFARKNLCGSSSQYVKIMCRGRVWCLIPSLFVLAGSSEGQCGHEHVDVDYLARVCTILPITVPFRFDCFVVYCCWLKKLSGRKAAQQICFGAMATSLTMSIQILF